MWVVRGDIESAAENNSITCHTQLAPQGTIGVWWQGGAGRQGVVARGGTGTSLRSGRGGHVGYWVTWARGPSHYERVWRLARKLLDRSSSGWCQESERSRLSLGRDSGRCQDWLCWTERWWNSFLASLSLLSKQLAKMLAQLAAKKKRKITSR